MRILHLETGRHLYGGALQVHYLLQGLRGPQWQHILVCPRNSAIAQASDTLASVHRLPCRGDADPRLPLQLIKLIRHTHPELIHVHSRRGADYWGGMAARLTGIPAVITRRVDNPEPRWLAPRKYRMYQRVAVISEGIRRMLLAAGVPDHRMVRIPSAVYPTQSDHSWHRDRFCQTFNLTPDQIIIGVVAQLIPRKGHRILIEAMPPVLAEYPQTRVMFFGRGPLRAQLEQLCRTRGLEQVVRFCGFREDLKAMLPCLDLLVHPALMEGLGVALLEAGAVGLPVISTCVGGIPDIISHGDNGLLLQPGDISGLTHAILDLLRHPPKASRMGTRAQLVVRKNFSVPAMARCYARLYREVRRAYGNTIKTPT